MPHVDFWLVSTRDFGGLRWLVLDIYINSDIIVVKIKYFINLYLGSSVSTIHFLKAEDDTILNGLMSCSVFSAMLLVHSL